MSVCVFVCVGMWVYKGSAVRMPMALDYTPISISRGLGVPEPLGLGVPEPQGLGPGLPEPRGLGVPEPRV